MIDPRSRAWCIFWGVCSCTAPWNLSGLTEFARPYRLRTHRNISYGCGSGTRPLTVSLIGRWFGHRVEPKHRSCTLTREVLGRLRPQYKEKGPLLKQMRPSKKTSSQRVLGDRESRDGNFGAPSRNRGTFRPFRLRSTLSIRSGHCLSRPDTVRRHNITVSQSQNIEPTDTTGQLPWTMRSHKRCGRLLEAWDRREVCSRSFDSDVVRAYSTLQVPEHARIEAPADTGIVASWFLLRGLEISSVVCEDIAFARDGLVKLHLPVSKVDPTARGCHRSHACICERRHDPGCYRSGDEALLFTPMQRCDCSLGRHPLCPYHAALRCAVRLRQSGRWHAKAPLCGDGQGPPTKLQIIWLARVFAWVLCEGDLRDWPRQVLQRWAQHAFRVAGAQLFARAELDLHVIMLIGRWGSSAICRYVQEAALANPTRLAVANRTAVIPAGAQPSRPAQLSILPAALDQVRAVVADCFRGQGVIVHNVRSKLAHKPCATECSTPSGDWLSACGRWKYGKASCQRNPTLLPGFRHCPLCFTEESSVAEVLESKDLAPEGSDSSSSSV